MKQDKVKVKLSGRSASMLGCLWGRAQVSKEYSSLFYDAKAIELAEKIDYVPDFSACCDVPLFQDIMFDLFHEINLLGPFTLRIKQFDDKIRAYIAEHPYASVICLAAGLDATFYRVDNGLIHWYDLDLPAVIDVRKQLLPEPDRVTYIAQSLLDPNWCKDINADNGVFMIAGGVFMWLEKSQVQQFFSMLADNFPDGEIVFDAMSRSDNDFGGTWIDRLSQEQRNTMRAALVEALKDWWKKAPQDQKDKVNDMIATLKIPTKPKGKEWSDLEAWWNQLSDKEVEEALRGFMTFHRGGVGTWALEDASEFTKWNNRITVIDQFPMFENIPRDSLSADMRRALDYGDESGRYTIIHLRV